MMDYTLAAVLAVFFGATGLLLNSAHERHLGIVFLIRSGYGIRLIDWLASKKKRFWEFAADYSVTLSFGGAGAYYLAATKKSSANLRYAMFASSILGAALAATADAYPQLALLTLCAIASVTLAPKTGNRMFSFVYGTLVYSLTYSVFFDALPSAFFGALGIPAAMVYVMSTHAFNIVVGSTDLPGVSPMVPSSREGELGVAFPGYDIFIPGVYALIALAVTLIVHEGAHGVLTRVADVKLKSTGLLTVAALPIGAFVEPDEEELNQRESHERMRVYTMGSFANIVVGALSFLLVFASTFLFTGIVYADGVKVVGHMSGYPAEDVIPEGAIIYSLNGQNTSDYGRFSNITGGLAPGKQVSLVTDHGEYTLELAENPEDPGKGYIGVYLSENLRVGGAASGFLSVGVLSFMINSLGWIAFFNVNIALVNLLPIIPFDGGRMFKELIVSADISHISMDRIVYGVLGFTAIVFLVNAIPLLKMIASYFIALV